MCVICIKNVGQQYPAFDSIKNCCDNNSDGFAMMWNEKGVVHNYKTLDKGAFLSYYKRFVMKHDASVTALVVHARIRTHGTKKIQNCHCWMCERGEIGFAHNGILSISSRGDMTDSETFLRDVFVPVYRSGGWRAADRAISCVIGSSKFAFLLSDGTVRRYGQWINHEGCLYSNTSYEKRIVYTSRAVSSYGGYKGYGYRASWDNDDDSSYGSSGYGTAWLVDYYKQRDEMWSDGMKIPRRCVSAARWMLMCEFHLGEITEKEYVEEVRNLPAAAAGTPEWYLDQKKMTIADGTTYYRGMHTLKQWECLVMKSAPIVELAAI